MRRLAAVAVALVVLSLDLAGCSRLRSFVAPPTPVTPIVQPIVAGDPLVDGLPIGGLSTNCVELGICSAIIDAAQQELDTRDPGHAAVVDVTIHDWGIAVDSQSRLIPHLTSGTVWVALFTLADGKRAAVDFGSMSLGSDPALDPGLTIDGFTLGVPAKCLGGTVVPGMPTPIPDTPRRDFLTLARAALDARDPNHGAIVSVDQYTDGTQPDSVDITGHATIPPQATRHPGPAVAVFVFMLADGTRLATGVACNGSGPCVGIGSYPN